MSDATSANSTFIRLQTLAAEKHLPAVETSTSYGNPALKVHGKAFVRLKNAETLVLHCPHEQKTLLMEISPEVYYETAHYVGHPAVLIRLAAIEDVELALRLEDAWHFKAPKRLSDEYRKAVTSA